MRKIKYLITLGFVAAGCIAASRWLYQTQQSRYRAGYETARVVYVIDGDTLIVEIEDSGKAGTDEEGGGRADSDGEYDGKTGAAGKDGVVEEYPHVRLLGIDCEESVSRIESENTEKGREASEFTRSLAEGMTVYLQRDESELDRYGRLLRYVWLEIPENPESEKEVREKMLNAKLLEAGLAREMWFEEDTLYRDIFHEIAAGAVP